MNAFVPFVGLAAIGLLVGAYGTLIGAGGGFVLVPLLLLLYPHESPTRLTAVSLAVVANSSSGSLSYYRLRLADYRSGAWLAIATVPGAILGAIVVGRIPRAQFELIMGVSLLIAGIDFCSHLIPLLRVLPDLSGCAEVAAFGARAPVPRILTSTGVSSVKLADIAPASRGDRQ